MSRFIIVNFTRVGPQAFDMGDFKPMPKRDEGLNPLDHVYAVFEFYYRPQCIIVSRSRSSRLA